MTLLFEPNIATGEGGVDRFRRFPLTLCLFVILFLVRSLIMPTCAFGIEAAADYTAQGDAADAASERDRLPSDCGDYSVDCPAGVDGIATIVANDSCGPWAPGASSVTDGVISDKPSLGQGAPEGQLGIGDSALDSSRSSDIAADDDESLMDSITDSASTVEVTGADDGLHQTTASSNNSQLIVLASNGGVPDENADSNLSANSASNLLQVASIVSSHPSTISYSVRTGGQLRSNNSSTWSSSSTEFFSSNLGGTAVGVTARPSAGYRFDGWYDESSGNLVSSELGFTPARPADGWPTTCSFVARFSPDSFAVQTAANGGSGIDYSAVSSFGVSVVVPSNPYVRHGYSFTGWDVALDAASDPFGGMHFDEGGSISPQVLSQLLSRGAFTTTGATLSLVLHAQWKESSVSLLFQGGDNGILTVSPGISSSTSSFSQKIGAVSGSDMSGYGNGYDVAAVANTGFHFAGWTVRAGEKDVSSLLGGGSSRSIISSLDARSVSNAAMGSSSIRSDLLFIASFSSNVYGVNYHSGSSGIGSSSISCESGGSFSSSGPSSGSMRFIGWNTSPDGSGVYLAPGSSASRDLINGLIARGALVDSDGGVLNLYAMYEAVSPVTPIVPNSPVEPASPVVEDDSVTPAIPGKIIETIESVLTPVVEPLSEVVFPELESPIVTQPLSSASEDQSLFSSLNNMTSAQAVAATGSVVTAVTAVGTIAALAGVGASALGAAVAGAAGATGASGFADIFAEIAADAKAIGRGPVDRLTSIFGRKRRRAASSGDDNTNDEQD